MAGNLIAMLRVLRLKNALQATVTSPEFTRLNAFGNLATVILNENVWVWMFLQCRGVYPMMRILRLADQKNPAMDKLYYYIKQANRVAPMCLQQAESYRNNLSQVVLSTITSTDDLPSENLEDDHDSDDDEWDLPWDIPDLDDDEEDDEEEGKAEEKEEEMEVIDLEHHSQCKTID